MADRDPGAARPGKWVALLVAFAASGLIVFASSRAAFDIPPLKPPTRTDPATTRPVTTTATASVIPATIPTDPTR